MACIGNFPIHILVQLLLVTVVGILRIDTIATNCSGYQAFVILQSLTRPYHKYISEVDLNLRSVLVISFNEFLLCETLKMRHSCDNHSFLPPILIFY